MFRTSTFAYIFIALGLFAYIMLIDRKNLGTDDSIHEHSILFEFEPDKVTDVSVSNHNGSFSFKRENHRWNLLAPIHAPADPTAVQEILDQINTTHSQGNIPIYDSTDPQTQANLKDWGLAPTPDSRVEFKTQDGKSFELLLGRDVAATTSVYARCSERKDEEVKYVNSALKKVVDHDLSTFRSRKVLDFDLNDITQVSAQIAPDGASAGHEFVAAVDTSRAVQIHTKSSDDNDKIWTLKKPLMTRASGEAVSSLLNLLQTLQAITFVSDDASNLSLYGLTTPAATFTITSSPANQKPEDIVLEIGSAVPNKPDQVYAQRLQTTSVFTVNRASINDIVLSLPKLRDLHILPIQVGNLTGISYEFKGKKVALQKDKTTWTIAGDPTALADSMGVVDIGEKLTNLESTPVIKDSPADLKPYGLDKPTGTLVLHSPDFKPSETLTLSLGKTENHLIYVKTSTEPTVFTIQENALDPFPTTNNDIHSPNVVMFDYHTIRGMSFVPPKGPVIRLERSEGGTWSAPDARNLMVDTNLAEQQAALISHIRAKTWLGKALPSYGLDKPALKIIVTQAQSKTPMTMTVGAVLPDGTHAAQVEGVKDVFGLDDADYGILTANQLRTIPSIMQSTPAPAPSPASSSKTPAPTSASAKPSPTKSK